MDWTLIKSASKELDQVSNGIGCLSEFHFELQQFMLKDMAGDLRLIADKLEKAGGREE